MSRYFTCGFETGYLIAGSSGGGIHEYSPNCGASSFSGGVPSGQGFTVVAQPSWWNSTGKYVAAMTGGHTYQVNYPDALTGVWFGFKWGTDVMPDAEAHIYEQLTGSFAVAVTSTGAIKYYNSTGGVTPKYVGPAGQIVAQQTYLLEMKIKSGDHQIWLNNVLLFSDTDAVDDFSSTSPILNDHQNVAAGCTFYFDDIYVNTVTASASGQTGRRGAASVMALLPASDVGAAPTGFTNSAGLTFGDPTTGWFSALDDTPPYGGGITDFVGKSTADANQYETSFQASPSGSTPNMAYPVMFMAGATALSCNVNANLKANGIAGSAQTYTLVTTTPQTCEILRGDTDVASSGVAWTKALVDGATLQWGSSSDVSPNPQMYAAYLMVEIVDPVPIPAGQYPTHHVGRGAGW